jgi:hypothetical protein
MTHDHTQVPASKDVCGRVDRNRLAYACPARTEKEAMARQAMNQRKRSQDEGIRLNDWPKKLGVSVLFKTYTHVYCTTDCAWRY